MRIRHLCLVLVGVALISVMALPVLAHWEKPGKSPGWWKHNFNANIEGKGKPHVSMDQLVVWVDEINGQLDWDPPPEWFYGYDLPPVADLDYDGNGIFGRFDPYRIFNDRDWNHLWTPLANWLNWASGRGPVW